MTPEVNNKTWASCEYQMWQQIASETNAWAVSSVADGAMGIMNFFVKHLNVKSLALLFCVSLMFDAAAVIYMISFKAVVMLYRGGHACFTHLYLEVSIIY